MTPKVFLAAPLCAAMALVSAPAQANNAAADVVAGVALGVLGSAVARHHHHHGSKYQDHPALSSEENAVGHCMMRTQTALENQGYYAVDFEKTLSYEINSDGINLIDLEVGRSDRRNDARSYIKAHCALQNGEVVNFRYSNY